MSIKSLRSQMRKLKPIKVLTSISLATTCLIILLILTFFGTLYQTDNGLYMAQQVFFNSWFVFFPIPGAKLVLIVLGANLLSVLLFTLKYTWKKAGIIFMHWGLTILVIGSGITYYYAEESMLSLSEGETKEFASVNSTWELAVWKEDESNEKQVFAIGSSSIDPDEAIELPAIQLNILPLAFFKNAGAVQDTTGWQAREGMPVNLNAQKKYLNGSGITDVRESELVPEISRNVPGIKFTTNVRGSQSEPLRIQLSGYETIPTTVRMDDQVFSFQLQRRQIQLPISVKLIDFVKEDHPGISMAKGYESTVEIVNNGVTRKVKISMNEPLRVAGFTFFQSSFSQDKMGREVSIFQVVQNPGRVIPYVSSIIVGIGLLLHFIILLVLRLRKERV